MRTREKEGGGGGAGRGRQTDKGVGGGGIEERGGAERKTDGQTKGSGGVGRWE